MIPILVTEEGVYSPPIPFGSTDAYSPISQGEAGREEIEERCIEFESKDSAIAYWVDRGYKVFVLYERRPV